MNWHHNVISKVPLWLFMWPTSAKNDTVVFNYYDNQSHVTNGSNCVIQNNVFISDDIWPAEALKIMKNARRSAITNKLTGISVTSNSSVLHVDDSLKLDFNFTSCDSINASVNWVSSDPAIATVSSNGLVNAKSLGNTTIIVTTMDGSITDSLEVIVVSRTGIADNLITSDFIYPNPATNKLYIRNLNSSNATITIFDMQGNQVLNKQINSGDLDISGLSKGLFIAKLVDSGKVLIKKFVKE